MQSLRQQVTALETDLRETKNKRPGKAKYRTVADLREAMTKFAKAEVKTCSQDEIKAFNDAVDGFVTVWADTGEPALDLARLNPSLGPDCPATARSAAVNAIKRGTAYAEKFQDAADQLTDRISSDQKDIQRLKARLNALGRNLSSPSSGIVIQKLPWLVGVIGLFSLAIMVMVQRFRKGVQTEWVKSGQVIQFMTVMVLTLTTMILGLAEVIKGETLGTLLGGMGGYVLSQGVGRAVANELNRKKGGGGSLSNRNDPKGGPDGDPKAVEPAAEKATKEAAEKLAADAVDAQKNANTSKPSDDVPPTSDKGTTA